MTSTEDISLSLGIGILNLSSESFINVSKALESASKPLNIDKNDLNSDSRTRFKSFDELGSSNGILDKGSITGADWKYSLCDNSTIKPTPTKINPGKLSQDSSRRKNPKTQPRKLSPTALDSIFLLSEISSNHKECSSLLLPAAPSTYDHIITRACSRSVSLVSRSWCISILSVFLTSSSKRQKERAFTLFISLLVDTVVRDIVSRALAVACIKEFTAKLAFSKFTDSVRATKTSLKTTPYDRIVAYDKGPGTFGWSFHVALLLISDTSPLGLQSFSIIARAITVPFGIVSGILIATAGNQLIFDMFLGLLYTFRRGTIADRSSVIGLCSSLVQTPQHNYITLRKIYKLVLCDEKREDSEDVIKEREEVLEYGRRRHGIALNFKLSEGDLEDIDNGDNERYAEIFEGQLESMVYGYDEPSLRSSIKSDSFESLKRDIISSSRRSQISEDSDNARISHAKAATPQIEPPKSNNLPINGVSGTIIPDSIAHPFNTSKSIDALEESFRQIADNDRFRSLNNGAARENYKEGLNAQNAASDTCSGDVFIKEAKPSSHNDTSHHLSQRIDVLEHQFSQIMGPTYDDISLASSYSRSFSRREESSKSLNIGGTASFASSIQSVPFEKEVGFKSRSATGIKQDNPSSCNLDMPMQVKDLGLHPGNVVNVDDFMTQRTKKSCHSQSEIRAPESDLIIQHHLHSTLDNTAANVTYPQHNQESLVLHQAPPFISVPFMKSRLEKATRQAIRHLMFGDQTKHVDYYFIYSGGLLCGQLSNASYKSQRPSNVPLLHPSLKQLLLLDMRFISELVNEIEFEPISSDSTPLKNWLHGLEAVHRCILPISKSIFKLETLIKKQLNGSEVMVIARDYISLQKLARGVNDYDYKNNSSVMMNTLEHANLSRVSASMLFVSSGLSSWLDALND